MKNADMPAMPLTGDAYTDINGSSHSEGRYEDGMGLTKREHFAAMAMQGFLANSWQAENLDESEVSSSEQMAIVAEIS